MLSAGGTGGHLFPALKLAEELKNEVEISFVSGGAHEKRLLDQSPFPFYQVNCSPLSLKRPLQGVKGGVSILKGVIKSIQLFRKQKPDLIVVFGSYFTFPVAAAAWCSGIPLLLHEQNALPGKVNRIFSSYASCTALTFPEAESYLKGESAHVLFPLRTCSTKQKEACYDYFDLSAELPILLVYGGSSGARQINQLILKSLTFLKRSWGNFQVIHCTGHKEDIAKMKAHYAAAQIAASIRPFEAYLDRALMIADLALTRAGSGTVNELIQYELPAVLVPYPYASENHQLKNAEHFKEKVRGGELLEEFELTEKQLAEVLLKVVSEKELLKRNIQSYKKLLPNQTLKDLVLEHLNQG